MKSNRCPICTAETTIEQSWGKIVGLGCEVVAEFFQVCCPGCNMQGPAHRYKTKAISLWNSLEVKKHKEEE